MLKYIYTWMTNTYIWLNPINIAIHINWYPHYVCIYIFIHIHILIYIYIEIVSPLIHVLPILYHILDGWYSKVSNPFDHQPSVSSVSDLAWSAAQPWRSHRLDLAEPQRWFQWEIRGKMICVLGSLNSMAISVLPIGYDMQHMLNRHYGILSEGMAKTSEKHEHLPTHDLCCCGSFL